MWVEGMECMIGYDLQYFKVNGAQKYENKIIILAYPWHVIKRLINILTLNIYIDRNIAFKLIIKKHNKY